MIEETRGVTAQIDRLQTKVSSSTDEINQLKEELEDARRDFWLNAPEALEYGLIDKVIRQRADLD